MKIALAQINPTVGDFQGNTKKIIDFAREAAAAQADVVMFPELAVCGYPPADFLDKPSFVARCAEATAEIAAAATAGTPLAVICGYVTPAPPGSGKQVANSAALLRNGVVEFVQSKRLLPFYDVFDEQRYFAPAEKPEPALPWGASALPSPSAKTPGTISSSGQAGFTPSIPWKN